MAALVFNKFPKIAAQMAATLLKYYLAICAAL